MKKVAEDQSEFRTQKVIKRKGDRLYVKRKGRSVIIHSVARLI